MRAVQRAKKKQVDERKQTTVRRRKVFVFCFVLMGDPNHPFVRLFAGGLEGVGERERTSWQ